MTKTDEQTNPHDQLAWVVNAAATIGILFGAIIFAPLVLPVVARKVAGERIGAWWRFWSTAIWQQLAAALGLILVLALAAVEITAFAQWTKAPAFETFLGAPDWQRALVVVLPWFVGNLAAGVALLPLAFLMHRRHLAAVVYRRHIADVQLQERIEIARARAADAAAAHRIGVKLNNTLGEVVKLSPSATRAPHKVNGRTAFGVIIRPTIRTLAERAADRRRVPGWLDKSGKFAVVPQKAGAIRGVMIAESSSGKTFLLNNVAMCSLEEGHPVFFIDAKGSTDDADSLAAVARGEGHTATVTKRWNFFNGSPAAVISKLLALISSDNQFYFDEAKGALQAVMPVAAVRSVDELYDRLTTPAKFPDIDERAVDRLMREVDKTGTTVGVRVRETLMASLVDLEPYIDRNGASFDKPPAELTIIPLTPVDQAQAKLGAVILLDLLNYLKEELERTHKTNMVTIVDEFAQLVVPGQDPGEVAARLLETMRTGEKGLILAAQTASGLSESETIRKRVFGSGAGLFIGRGKDQDEVAKLAGTVTRIESSGAPTGDELNSARAQNTYTLHPNTLRLAAVGQFWLVQAGAVESFRVLPGPATPPASSIDSPATSEEMINPWVAAAQK